jgi:hypothetical protein
VQRETRLSGVIARNRCAEQSAGLRRQVVPKEDPVVWLSRTTFYPARGIRKVPIIGSIVLNKSRTITLLIRRFRVRFPGDPLPSAHSLSDFKIWVTAPQAARLTLIGPNASIPLTSNAGS